MTLSRAWEHDGVSRVDLIIRSSIASFRHRGKSVMSEPITGRADRRVHCVYHWLYPMSAREELGMDYERMTREELLSHIRSVNDDLSDVVVMWGSRKDLRETFARVAANADSGFTQEEARNAAIILEAEGAFEEFIEMLRDSFERGGIGYALSEKISALMEQVASKHKGN
jgi:hypothetical protein